jgi:tetratricopeptide (TPR) repeat protein
MMYMHARAKLFRKEETVGNHQVGGNVNELQKAAIRLPQQFANAFCGPKVGTAFCSGHVSSVQPEPKRNRQPRNDVEVGSLRAGYVPLLLESRRSETMPDRQQAEDYYYAALDHVAEGNDEQAVEDYRKSLIADPTFTDALHGLSRALQNLNRLDEAIEVSQRIAELDPDDVLAHTSLSIIYQKKGMVPEAEAEANKARVLGWKQQLKGSKPGS